MPRYTPKYEHGIANPGGGVASGRGSAWDYGPAQSGVYCFRHFDAREKERASELGGGRSELQVKIRRRSGSVTDIYTALHNGGTFEVNRCATRDPAQVINSQVPRVPASIASDRQTHKRYCPSFH